MTGFVILQTVACVGVPHVRRVIPSSQHALQPVAHCMQTRTGCVRPASIMLFHTRLPTDVRVRSAMHQSVPKLCAYVISQSKMYSVELLAFRLF